MLQDGTFSRIGGDSILKANVRIIAAANSDLEDAISKGMFRKDLFYRLNVFPIQIPALRERLEDLVDLFLKKLNVKYGKNIHRVHPSVLEGFRHYEWPGNLPIATQMAVAQDIPVPGTDLTLACQHAVNACEIFYLTSLLKQTNGRVKETAQKAGITVRQLRRLLTRHGLDKKQFPPPPKKKTPDV